MHHDAATKQSRLSQQEGMAAGGQRCRTRGEDDEEEAAQSGWAEGMNEWGGIQSEREFENG